MSDLDERFYFDFELLETIVKTTFTSRKEENLTHNRYGDMGKDKYLSILSSKLPIISVPFDDNMIILSSAQGKFE